MLRLHSVVFLSSVFLLRRQVHGISNEGRCECCNGERPEFYAKVLLVPMFFHWANNFLVPSVGTSQNNDWIVVMALLNLLIQLAGWCYLRTLYLKLASVPRVNVAKLQHLGRLPKAAKVCCCYCCANDGDGTRRRLDSIYKMQDKLVDSDELKSNA